MEFVPSPLKTAYDVFLSFRGVDTRYTFTSHLFQKLVDKNIETFIDNRLNRGEEIESFLIKVIEESQISVIVFSKGYASSPWCLDELVKILECREIMGRIVLPIFYLVDVSDVEQLTGTFGDGFRALEAEHKTSTMIRWRNALKEATTISGWVSKKHRPDSDLIEEVVKEIMKKISPTSYSISNNLVGLDSKIQQILPLLGIGSTDVRVLGLWGMGGIGKTTVAEALLSRISDQFDGCCFMRNVREESSKCGLVEIRKCFFSKLLGSENLSIEMFHALPTVVINRLRRKKVIIVIDDVNDSEQLEALVGNLDWFGAGSRVIVTSRDKQVLQNKVHVIHGVKQLNYNDAVQLLSLITFKGKKTPKNYTELLERAVNFAGGIPLALQVLGSHLCQRAPEEWEIILRKLRRSLDPKVHNILKVSYNELEKESKDMFLDIAVFFRRWSRIRVGDILKCCNVEGFKWELIHLQEKCLLSIRDDDMLDMHNLIHEMGREIAQREGSILSNSRDICQMLTNNTGNKSVQGMYLDISEIENIHLHPKAFSKMKNLRLLKFYKPCDRQVNKEPAFILRSGQSKYLQCLPNSLSFFYWEEYPCISLPLKFSIENLVELSMPRSKITQLWDGDKCPQNLKRLDLSECRQLKKLPKLCYAKNLEVMQLIYCESLIEIDLTISGLQKLVHLDLSGCKKLKMLPEIPRGIKRLYLSESGVEKWSPCIQFLKNLHSLEMINCKNITSLPILNFDKHADPIVYLNLDLSGLCNLHELPDITGNVGMINLSEMAIKELPSSIGSLSSLVVLVMSGCENLEILPGSICKLKCLTELDLRGCSKLQKLPLLYGLISLEYLFLDGTAIEEIPKGIVSLTSLRTLSLSKCKSLKGLPKLPLQLEQLQVQNCISLRTVELSPYVPYMKEWRYKWFNYFNCWNLEENARCNIIAQAKLSLKEITRKIKRYSIMVGIPGTEIPDWYKYQSQGSSYSIKLSSYCLNNLFLGFDLSIVLEFNSLLYKRILCECECKFRNVTGEKSGCFNCEMDIYDFVGSDHVLIWYNYADQSFDHLKYWLIQNKCNAIEASFEFKAYGILEEDYHDRSGYKASLLWNKFLFNTKKFALNVKKCGIHLIYDNEDKKKEFSGSEIETCLSSQSKAKEMDTALDLSAS